MVDIALLVVAAACTSGCVIWAHSAQQRLKLLRRLERTSGDRDAKDLARAAVRNDAHNAGFYFAAMITAATLALFDHEEARLVGVLLLAPVGATLVFSRDFSREVRLAQSRAELEQRAQEVLTQDALAPKRWSARLAPDDFPEIEGFEVGQAYQPGAGMMAGDFYDLFQPAPTRLAAIIGDVTGHGIEPAITAFQAKYLLRVFLRQYRDPAQALEELNRQMSSLGRDDEMISLSVVLFDTEAGTLRYCSAGHPAMWLWHDREVLALRATGPLLMLSPTSTFVSHELSLEIGDLCVMYTDGLSEVRSGDTMFGEERIGNMLRRDPGVEPAILCRSLLEAAKDFSSGPLNDDLAILAVKRL